MRKTIATSRGYSLMELLVVVAMAGIVMLVTVPALLQLMPQYRIRSAASEAAGNIRMIRQRATSTRSAWRVSLDLTNNRYRYYMLKTPNADLSVATNWKAVGRDGHTVDNYGDEWIPTPAVDLNTTASPFNDVACPPDAQLDIIFLRDGSVSNKEPCGGTSTDVLTFSPEPSIVFSVDSSYVRFNRYYLAVAQNGMLTVTPSKE